MNTDTPEITDALIRDTLVKYNVITNKRTKKCGSWMNTKRGIDRHIHSPYIYRCNYYECPVCRRSKYYGIHIEHIKQNKSFRDQGGEHLMISLSIPTTAKDKGYRFMNIYKRFKKSLTEMRNNGVWRKLLRDINCKYWYEKWEIPKNNSTHLHIHIVCAVLGNLLPLDEIRQRLFATWKRYTNKNGFRKLSKKNVYITPPPKPDFEIDDYTNKDGRLEKLEELFTRSKLELTEKFASRISVYKSLGLTEKQIVPEIRSINTCFEGSIRGRIHYQ